MCVCGSVSIVVGMFFFSLSLSISSLKNEWGLQVQLLLSLSTVFSPRWFKVHTHTLGHTLCKDSLHPMVDVSPNYGNTKQIQ